VAGRGGAERVAVGPGEQNDRRAGRQVVGDGQFLVLDEPHEPGAVDHVKLFVGHAQLGRQQVQLPGDDGPEQPRGGEHDVRLDRAERGFQPAWSSRRRRQRVGDLWRHGVLRAAAGDAGSNPLPARVRT
jgi:hypothetical protein